MTGRPRSNVAEVPAYRPGRSAAQAEAEYGIAEAIKLASNELPHGPLPSVAGAVAAGIESVHLYPDARSTELRESIAGFHGVDVSHVAVGAGSVGILQQLVLAYCDPGDEIAMCWPSFEAYPLLAQLAGAQQVRVPLADERFDLVALADAVTAATKLAFVTNPNNPTGTAVTTDEVVRFLESVPPTCLVVLDEAYAEFVTDPGVTASEPLLDRFDNLVITRTFSKAHGLASLRVGYALAHPEVAGMIDRTLVPFALNDMAQRAAVASLGAIDEMRTRVAEVVAERTRVARELRTRGWTVPDPQGNFVWLPLGGRSAEVGVELERRGVVTRAFPEVGVRITVVDAAGNDRLIAALAEIAPD
ncbi:MAG: histidinol-phosphate transaminase [Actinomycetota bacterium]